MRAGVKRAAAAALVVLGLAAWTTGCAGPRAGAPAAGPASLQEEAAREALLRAARAMRAGRWIDAWTLLSARWRAAATPGRLAADYQGAGPVAQESVDRVVALLESGAPLGQVGPGRFELPVGPGRAARLVSEGGTWRVDSLE
jgi:hypothetical protein